MDIILAEKIMTLRKKNGWSQEELANQLSVSRQSVSKWESAQSVPELEKILMMSKLFGVTTDYLLKDDIEEEEYTLAAEEIVPVMRKVTMEEANAFLKVKDETAKYIAFGVFLCIISPITLLLLCGFSEAGVIGENVAVGIGCITLLLLVAMAVAIFLFCGAKASPFEYLEKESFETEYGVNGMVKECQKRYSGIYARNNVIGVCLCILGVIPIFAGILLDAENGLLMIAMVCLLLLIVGIGVIFFVIAGVHWESYQKLLQEGDYTGAKKRGAKKNEKIQSVYWIVVTTIYLGWSFYTMAWHRTWIVWPVAGVLSGVIAVICSILYSKDE